MRMLAAVGLALALSACATTSGTGTPPTLAQQAQKACGVLPTEEGIVQIVLMNQTPNVKTTGVILSVQAALALICAYYGVQMTGPVATPAAMVQIMPTGGSTIILSPSPPAAVVTH